MRDECQDKTRLGGPWRWPKDYGFARSSRGSAVTEYALLLGAIACVVIAGIGAFHEHGNSAYQKLAGSLGTAEQSVSDGKIAAHPPAENRQNLGASSETRMDASEAPSSHRSFWVFVVAAFLTTGLWLVERTQRLRATKETEDEENSSKREDNRLHDKRQILWKNILEDPKLLFKNRVEARHLMTRNVTVVAQRTQSDEICQLMAEKRIHHVLVCDGDGTLLGVVSDRDVPRSGVKAAREIMSEELTTVRPDTTASAAIATMLEKEISSVPVVDGERLCGILTRTDLLLSLQCMLQWWLRFVQSLTRTADCFDKLDAVQEASGRFLGEQRGRLHFLCHVIGEQGHADDDGEWKAFEEEAKAFLDTAGELIAMQTFEGDRLSEMAREIREVTKL